jgi:hypothetical protein
MFILTSLLVFADDRGGPERIGSVVAFDVEPGHFDRALEVAG